MNYITKFLFFLLCVFSGALLSQKISGKIIDAETKLPLSSANIELTSSKLFTTSDNDGDFSFPSFQQNEKLKVSYLGYENFYLTLDGSQSQTEIVVELIRAILPSQSVLVNAFRKNYSGENSSFIEIGRSKIETERTIDDAPDYLSSLPSTTFYTENGGAIGYSYLQIRGFDQRRISIAVNGIPQNDPEDHNVYWVDMSDLISNAEMIQVQRGSGGGINGYPAIGGAINIITSNFSDKAKINFSSFFGSFNTRRFNLAASSGLIDNKYSIYAKLGKIKSSGYRDLSWVDFNSYFFSVIRYDEKFTTQLNAYGGPISDGLVYTGLPKFAVKDRTLRRKNFSYFEEANGAITFAVDRKPVEIENFSQPHYEILTEYKPTENITINNALFLVFGNGFFDYDGSWSIYYDDYFRLRANGYDTNFVPQNAIIRAMVENKQWGIIPRANVVHDKGELTVGAEIRFHNSMHWGRINFAENIPPNVPADYRYYQYEVEKIIFNLFVNEKYYFDEKFSVVAEVQAAYHQYKIKNEKYAGNNFSISNLFLNPRIILGYKFNEAHQVSFAAARVKREPRLKNYYDAAESSGGEIPKFNLNSDGTYDFNSPLVHPETMNNFELGYSFDIVNYSFSLNYYFMMFNDEIVSRGQVDRFGQPITGNMKRTLHQGIEFNAIAQPIDEFETILNFTFSKNKISEGKTFISYSSAGSNVVHEINLANTEIAGFPQLMGNLIFNYRAKNLFAQLKFKYVDDFYSDNFGENFNSLLLLYPNFVFYPDNKNNSYFTADFLVNYNFKVYESMNENKIYLQVRNIFDALYSAYAIGGEFFPAAERNFLFGAEFSF